MNKLKLLLIDKDMTTCIIELDHLQFRGLEIPLDSPKRNKNKREMNSVIKSFLDSFKEEKK